MSFHNFIVEKSEAGNAFKIAKEAMLLLQEASAKLESADMVWKQSFDESSIFEQYQKQVDELISSNHGEAGLKADIENFYKMEF